MKTTNANTIKVAAAKAATSKKVLAVAAVMPIVNTKTKKVFMKIAKGNADRSIEATINAIEMKKIDSFEGKARIFVKEQGFDHLKLWTSRIAKVQPSSVAKSATRQMKFWIKQGFDVVNASDFETIQVETNAVELKPV